MEKGRHFSKENPMIDEDDEKKGRLMEGWCLPRTTRAS
jgi:hypothetical protein